MVDTLKDDREVLRAVQQYFSTAEEKIKSVHDRLTGKKMKAAIQRFGISDSVVDIMLPDIQRNLYEDAINTFGEKTKAIAERMEKKINQLFALPSNMPLPLDDIQSTIAASLADCTELVYIIAEKQKALVKGHKAWNCDSADHNTVMIRELNTQLAEIAECTQALCSAQETVSVSVALKSEQIGAIKISK